MHLSQNTFSKYLMKLLEGKHVLLVVTLFVSHSAVNQTASLCVFVCVYVV